MGVAGVCVGGRVTCLTPEPWAGRGQRKRLPSPPHSLCSPAAAPDIQTLQRPEEGERGDAANRGQWLASQTGQGRGDMERWTKGRMKNPGQREWSVSAPLSSCTQPAAPQMPQSQTLCWSKPAAWNQASHSGHLCCSHLSLLPVSSSLQLGDSCLFVWKPHSRSSCMGLLNTQGLLQKSGPSEPEKYSLLPSHPIHWKTRNTTNFLLEINIH